MSALEGYLQLLQQGAYAALAAAVMSGINLILLIIILICMPTTGTIVKRVRRSLEVGSDRGHDPAAGSPR